MKFVHSSKKPTTDDNLIPLINVVFLMLIFFMVAGKISASDVLDVQLPTSENTHSKHVDAVKLLIDDKGNIALNQEFITIQELSIQLDKIIESNTLMPNHNSSKPPVNIKADANVSAERLYEVFSILKTSGIYKVTLLTISG